MDILNQWAVEQGFETFIEDHRAVMSNLDKWLSKREHKCVNIIPQDYDLSSPLGSNKNQTYA